MNARSGEHAGESTPETGPAPHKAHRTPDQTDDHFTCGFGEWWEAEGYDQAVAEAAREDERLAAIRRGEVPPCPCECNRGGFCGGCGHAGCGGRQTRE